MGATSVRFAARTQWARAGIRAGPRPRGRTTAKRIFFIGASEALLVVNRDGQKRDIYVMRDDGSAAHKVTDGLQDADPQWSPDGHNIAFTRYSGNPANPHIGVYVMGAHGSQKTKVSGEKGGQSPAWAPPVNG